MIHQEFVQKLIQFHLMTQLKNVIFVIQIVDLVIVLLIVLLVHHHKFYVILNVDYQPALQILIVHKAIIANLQIHVIHNAYLVA